MKCLQWITHQFQKKLSAPEEEKLVNGWQKALSPAELLLQTQVVERLYELKQLISVTPDYYQTLYLKPLQSFAALVQQLPHPLYPHYAGKNGLLLAALDRTLAALKFRRGYMLPVGADTETCYREQDVWTYAVFTSALLQDCWLLLGAFQIAIKFSKTEEAKLWNPIVLPEICEKQYYRFTYSTPVDEWRTSNPVLVKALLSDKALTWLGSYPHLFNLWWKNIAGQMESNNPFNELLQKVWHSLFQHNNSEKTLLPISNDKNVENSQIVVVNENQTDALNLENKLLEENNDSSTIIRKTHTTLSEKLILAIKHYLHNNSANINHPDSFIHRVPEGIFLAIPNIFDWWFSHAPSIKDHVAVNNHETHHHAILRVLFEENRLIKNIAHNSPLHRYFLGRWEARQVLAGLLVPIEDLFAEQDAPAINEQLHLEPAI